MLYKVNCKHCNRYCFDAVGTTIVEGLICSNTKCRAKLNIKVVSQDATPEQLRYKFLTPEQPPKTKEIKE